MGTLKFKPIYLLYLLPGAIMMYAFFVHPFIQTVIYSLYDWDGIGEMVFVGLRNYEELLGIELFQQSVWRVLQFAFIQPAVQVTVGLLLAYMLRTRIRGSKFFRSVFFMPVVISSAMGSKI